MSLVIALIINMNNVIKYNHLDNLQKEVPYVTFVSSLFHLV